MWTWTFAFQNLSFLLFPPPICVPVTHIPLVHLSSKKRSEEGEEKGGRCGEEGQEEMWKEGEFMGGGVKAC